MTKAPATEEPPTLPGTARIEVHGRVADEFSEVSDALARGIARQGRGGGALCVYIDGEQVVDLTAGDLEPHALVQVFSVGKGVVALAAAHAVAAGLLDLDRPLGADWTPFSRAATAKITPRMVLAHTAGIPAITTVLSLDELLGDGLDRAVELQDPLWEPGSRIAYGAFTFGALMAGVFRHQVGIPLAEYVARNLTGPTRTDFRFGVAPTDAGRLAPLSFSPPVATPAQAAAEEQGIAIRDGAFAAVATDPAGFFGDARVQQAEWPAMAGIGSASSLARLFAAAVAPIDGFRLLDDDAVESLSVEQSSGYDPMLFHHTRFGLGLELPHAQFPFLGPGSLGHQGAGGSVVGIDPSRRVALAFVSTAFPTTVGQSDAAALVTSAVRQILDERQKDFA